MMEMKCERRLRELEDENYSDFDAGTAHSEASSVNVTGVVIMTGTMKRTFRKYTGEADAIVVKRVAEWGGKLA